MKNYKSVLLSVCLIMDFSLSIRAAQNLPNGEFLLALKAVEPIIKKGTSPEFLFTIKNISNGTKKILNVEKRLDLLNAYCRLVVTQKGGQSVKNLMSEMWDPGPFGDSDYIEIPPGGEKKIRITKYSLVLKALPPGIYETYIRYWPNPRDRSEYPSPMAEFAVTE
jgi:hypothetical protein